MCAGVGFEAEFPQPKDTDIAGMMRDFNGAFAPAKLSIKGKGLLLSREMDLDRVGTSTEALCYPEVPEQLVVIGAGAAGMMCAATAAARGRRVALIDHAAKLAEKIRISGGGRCNFTNLYAGPANYLSDNPHFCRSALTRYTPQDFLALLRRYDIGWHEKHRGQLFCNDSATRISV